MESQVKNSTNNTHNISHQSNNEKSIEDIQASSHKEIKKSMPKLQVCIEHPNHACYENFETLQPIEVYKKILRPYIILKEYDATNELKICPTPKKIENIRVTEEGLDDWFAQNMNRNLMSMLLAHKDFNVPQSVLESLQKRYKSVDITAKIQAKNASLTYFKIPTEKIGKNKLTPKVIAADPTLLLFDANLLKPLDFPDGTPQKIETSRALSRQRMTIDNSKGTSIGFPNVINKRSDSIKKKDTYIAKDLKLVNEISDKLKDLSLIKEHTRISERKKSITLNFSTLPSLLNDNNSKSRSHKNSSYDHGIMSKLSKKEIEHSPGTMDSSNIGDHSYSKSIKTKYEMKIKTENNNNNKESQDTEMNEFFIKLRRELCLSDIIPDEQLKVNSSNKHLAGESPKSSNLTRSNRNIDSIKLKGKKPNSPRKLHSMLKQEINNLYNPSTQPYELKILRNFNEVAPYIRAQTKHNSAPSTKREPDSKIQSIIDGQEGSIAHEYTNIDESSPVNGQGNISSFVIEEVNDLIDSNHKTTFPKLDIKYERSRPNPISTRLNDSYLDTPSPLKYPLSGDKYTMSTKRNRNYGRLRKKSNALGVSLLDDDIKNTLMKKFFLFNNQNQLNSTQEIGNNHINASIFKEGDNKHHKLRINLTNSLSKHSIYDDIEEAHNKKEVIISERNSITGKLKKKDSGNVSLLGISHMSSEISDEINESKYGSTEIQNMGKESQEILTSCDQSTESQTRLNSNRNDISIQTSPGKKKTVERDNVEFWFIRGMIQMNKDSFFNAIDCFKQVLLLDPKNYLSIFNIGCIYERLSKFDAARKWLKLTLELNFCVKESYYALALCDFKTLNFHGAYKALREVEKLSNKPQINVIYLLALCAKEMKELQLASHYYQILHQEIKQNLYTKLSKIILSFLLLRKRVVSIQTIHLLLHRFNLTYLQIADYPRNTYLNDFYIQNDGWKSDFIKEIANMIKTLSFWKRFPIETIYKYMRYMRVEIFPSSSVYFLKEDEACIITRGIMILKDHANNFLDPHIMSFYREGDIFGYDEIDKFVNRKVEVWLYSLSDVELIIMKKKYFAELWKMQNQLHKYLYIPFGVNLDIFRNLSDQTLYKIFYELLLRDHKQKDEIIYNDNSYLTSEAMNSAVDANYRKYNIAKQRRDGIYGTDKRNNKIESKFNANDTSFIYLKKIGKIQSSETRGFYIILQGECIVEHLDGSIMTVLTPGDYFGEKKLLSTVSVTDFGLIRGKSDRIELLFMNQNLFYKIPFHEIQIMRKNSSERKILKTLQDLIDIKHAQKRI